MSYRWHLIITLGVVIKRFFFKVARDELLTLQRELVGEKSMLELLNRHELLTLQRELLNCHESLTFQKSLLEK